EPFRYYPTGRCPKLRCHSERPCRAERRAPSEVGGEEPAFHRRNRTAGSSRLKPALGMTSRWNPDPTNHDALLFQKRPLLQVTERRLQLLLRVHHDGTVPRHGFFQRLA